MMEQETEMLWVLEYLQLLLSVTHWQRKMAKSGGKIDWQENISIVKIKITWGTHKIRWGSAP